jgi:hypothetical protein
MIRRLFWPWRNMDRPSVAMKARKLRPSGPLVHCIRWRLKARKGDTRSKQQRRAQHGVREFAGLGRMKRQLPRLFDCAEGVAIRITIVEPCPGISQIARRDRLIAASTTSLRKWRHAMHQYESHEVISRLGAVDGAHGVRSMRRHEFYSAALFAPVTASASVSGRQASEQPVTIVLAAYFEAIHALG